MTRHVPIGGYALLALLFTPLACIGAADWTGDLTPISRQDWNAQLAAHLLERAGFGGTPEEIAQFAAMTPEAAVRRLVYHKDIANDLPAFDHSGVHDPGLEPFPASRPAATDLAKDTGESMGIKVKPAGNRRLQPVANKFFYWLGRAGSRPIGSPIGGPIACLPRSGHWKRRWRCSGTVISRPAKKKSAITARCSSKTSCSVPRVPATSASC